MSYQIINWTTLVLAVTAAALAGWSWWSTRRLNSLRKSFFAGSNGADLEGVISLIAASQSTLQAQLGQLEAEAANMRRDFGWAVQKIGLVRFNPFADGGGNFSFCLALLDGRDHGFVLTSMHGREQHRIYAKKILSGESEIALTEEEKQAIQTAKQSGLPEGKNN